VPEFFPRLRRWWDTAWSSWSGPRLPYLITCLCGQTFRGHRGRRHRVERCPSCLRSVFILPSSPYPAPSNAAPLPASTDGQAKPHLRPTPRGRAFRLPLLAALTTIVAALAGYFWAWPLLVRQPEPTPPTRRDTEAQERLAAGKAAFHEGSYALALEKLTDAHRLRERDPAALTDDEKHQLNRLYWECELYAKLVKRDIAERVLADLRTEAGLHLNPQDWDAYFRQNYRGKTVIFDVTVPLDKTRNGVVDRGNKVNGRIRVEDLQLLGYLPAPPRRWIFGARLASVQDDAFWGWLIRLEPDSGVLLTDRQALVSWNPSLAKDAELDEILQRQRDKLPSLPAHELPP
jgi:hypothetical protein